MLKQIKLLTLNQLMLFFLFISIFCPVYITVLYSTVLIGYIIFTKQFIHTFGNIPKSMSLVICGFIAVIVSAIYSNEQGVLISLGFIYILPIVYFYRYNVDRNLFYLLIKISTLMSLVAAVFGLIQYAHILMITDSTQIFPVFDAPDLRVYSFFLNANFYATMIEFVILMAVYKLMIVKDRYSSEIYYILIIIVNSFMLYLTGCRTAWIAIFAAIPIMFLFKKKYLIGIVILFVEIGILIFSFYYGIFPRIDSISEDLLTRIEIWKVGIYNFINHPLFGMGPHSYSITYKFFNAPKTVHTHSLYIEMLSSFGIVTLSIASVYWFEYIKLYFKSSHQKSYSFIVGVVVAIMVHGLIDITILNLQTGLFFLLIISSIRLTSKEKLKLRKTY